MSALRHLARRAMCSAPLAGATRWASSLARVDHLAAAPPPPRHPFVVCLTIDTEAGYLREDLDCVWSDVDPRAMQGFTDGIPVLLNLAREAGLPLTFLASSQGFVARGAEGRRVRHAFDRLVSDGHELGLHLHPRTDELLHRELGRELRSASAHFYDGSEQLEMLLASRALFRRHLGVDAESALQSFRWGNWALATPSVDALERAGFALDSSALPGKRDHQGTDRYFDWSRVSTRYPFRLSRGDYQDASTQDSSVLEMPVATFRLLGSRVADATWGLLLESVLARYHRDADRSLRPFVFVVSTHSPEVVFADGRPTPMAECVARFLRRAAQLPDVRFATLREAAEFVRAPQACRGASTPLA